MIINDRYEISYKQFESRIGAPTNKNRIVEVEFDDIDDIMDNFENNVKKDTQ